MRMKINSNKFSFKYEERKKFLIEIQSLNSRKTSQQNDIPVKILKEDSDICSYIVHHNFNNFLFSNKFPKYLKREIKLRLLRKMKNFRKPIIDGSAFCPLYQKFMNDVYTIR